MSFLPEDLLERNLKKVDKEMNQICLQLGFSSHVKERAYKLYKKSIEKGFIRGSLIEGMASACVYITIRLQNSPIGLDELSNISKVDKRKIDQCYKLLVTQLKLTID